MGAAPLDFLAIPGSLRSGSLNRQLAFTLSELVPEDVRVDVFELHDIPLYDTDIDNDDDRPAAVVALKERVTAADAVILLCPEYNYGPSGVLKNAIDWASRPGFNAPMTRKPTGIMGVARGLSGTMRAQEQLKLNLLGMLAQLFPHRGVAVSQGGGKFEDGRLVDEETRDFVATYLDDFAGWVRVVRQWTGP